MKIEAGICKFKCYIVFDRLQLGKSTEMQEPLDIVVNFLHFFISF